MAGVAVAGLIATLALIRRDELGGASAGAAVDRRSDRGRGRLPPPMAREYPTILDLVGRHADRPARPDLAGRAGNDPREARVHEPGRLEQGPDRARDDRGGRARRQAEARRHDRRAHLGQHRRRPRDRGGAEGLPLHLRDARQDEPGEDLDAARLRRRGRDHADGGRPRLARVVLLRLVAARRGDPRRLQARPVLEHGEPGGALPHDRPGDLGADRRRDRRDRHLGRHRRHDQRRRPLLQGAQARGEDRRRRPGGLGLHREERRATCIRTSSRGSARTPGPRRWTRRSSTSGCASPTATRSSRRAASRARRGCSSAARPGSTIAGALEYAQRLGAGRAGADDPARLGPLVPLEVPRRQLDARARLPRALGAGADGARAAALEAGRDAAASSRSPRTRRSPRRSR